MEAIGLMAFGFVVLLCAPFRHYHDSRRSRWQVARFGLICLVLGAAFFAWDAWR